MKTIEGISLTSKRLGIKHETLKRWCQRGLIPGATKIGEGNRATWYVPCSIAVEDLPKLKVGRPRKDNHDEMA